MELSRISPATAGLCWSSPIRLGLGDHLRHRIGIEGMGDHGLGAHASSCFDAVRVIPTTSWPFATSWGTSILSKGVRHDPSDIPTVRSQPPHLPRGGRAGGGGPRATSGCPAARPRLGRRPDRQHPLRPARQHRPARPRGQPALRHRQRRRPDPLAAIWDALDDWPADELLLCTRARRVALPHPFDLEHRVVDQRQAAERR